MNDHDNIARELKALGYTQTQIEREINQIAEIEQHERDIREWQNWVPTFTPV